MTAPKPTIADARSFLAGTELFGNLSPDELDQLLSYARVHHLTLGQVLFEKGAAGDKLFVILSGRMKIGVITIEGKEVVFNILGRGEVFGKIALLDGKSRTADANAMTDCDLLSIDRSDFLPFLGSNPQVAARIIAGLCKRVRGISQNLEDGMTLDLPRLIARKLLVLTDAYGRPVEDGGLRIDIRLSQKDLAAMTGISRESVNKHLKVWQDAGWISVKRATVTVRDRAMLERLVDPG